jgi:HD-like signal output (HDOD) protein
MPTASPVPSTAKKSDTDPLLDAVLLLVGRDEVKVPPIPSVVVRLSEMLTSPTCEMSAVVQLVGTDQALAAHILRCASGAVFATRTRVTSLTEAVMRVGTNGLFSLSVSFALGRDVGRSSPLQSLRREMFRQAAASAEFCRRLAGRRGADPEGAFLCGLLASFGQTIALGAIEQVMKGKPTQQGRPPEYWTELARRCDQEMSAKVASQWGMPTLVSEVVSARRSGSLDPRLVPYAQLLDMVEPLTRLFYQDATPSEVDIAKATGCSKSEAAEIAAFLPEVASSVWALGAAGDDVKVSHTVHMAVLDSPRTSLRGELVPVSIPVTIDRKGGDHQLVCVGLAADGFVAHGTTALPLNQVVKCRLVGLDEDLELVAVVAAVAKNGEYRFEIKPMGLTGGYERKWQKLRDDAAREASISDAFDGGAAEPPPPSENAPGDPVDVDITPRRRGATSAESGVRQGGYVSMHDRPSIFRRLTGLLRGRDGG